MRYLLLGLLALGSVAGAARAQEAGVDYKVEIEPGSVFSTLRDKTRLVTVRFQIRRAAEGDVVTGVPREEIRVEEDGQPVAALEVFQPKAQALSVVLAIDISGSMARGSKMDQAKQAALAFLQKLDDRATVGLILFDHQIRAAEPLTTDRAKLHQLIHEAKPTGGTAYLDATVRAVEMLKNTRGRRLVVVLTDGVDMNSRATLDEAIHASVTAELPVYTVGIGKPGENAAVTTVLVLDRSGSMFGKADEKDDLSKIDGLKRAATRFVELMRPTAKTALVPFSSDTDPIEDFSDDKPRLVKRIQELTPEGGTLLYDSTGRGVETLVASGAKGRRAVVVLTDGRDEAPGSRQSDDDVIARAKEAGVPLYMLGLGRADDINEPVMKKMATETRGKYYHAGNQQQLLEVFEELSIEIQDDGIDVESLRTLATKTGGKYAHVDDVSKLQIFYETLADELQTTYTVTFESRRASHDGTARGIDVKVVRGGKVVSTVGSVDDVARGVLVPQMSYGVYLGFLAGLVALAAAPAGLRRLRAR